MHPVEQRRAEQWQGRLAWAVVVGVVLAFLVGMVLNSVGGSALAESTSPLLQSTSTVPVESSTPR